tara:strand:+ start:1606 stop:2118 length:513 start_codon:yes stop_codon:yes gene_type:complete
MGDDVTDVLRSGKQTLIARHHYNTAKYEVVERKNITFLITSATVPEKPTEYLATHAACVRDLVGKDRKFVMIFDFRGAKLPLRWAESMIPFVKTHQSLAELYMTHLHNTVFILDNQAITDTFNTVLKTLYKPVRPFHFVCCHKRRPTGDPICEDVRTFVKSQLLAAQAAT